MIGEVINCSKGRGTDKGKMDRLEHHFHQNEKRQILKQQRLEAQHEFA